MTRNLPSSNFATSKTYKNYVPEIKPFNNARPVSVSYENISCSECLTDVYFQAIIVGAGIGGIAAAVLLQNKVPNLTYTVYEKNKRVVSTIIASDFQLLITVTGRNVGRKYLSWCSLRCPLPFIPVDL